MSLNGYGWLRQTQGAAREDRPPVPGAVQNSAPFGHHADYSARRIFLDVDDVPPAKRPSRRAPTLSCGCLGDWQRDKRSAAAPHRKQTRLVRGLSRCRSAYPSVRWLAKLCRCGSRSKSTDKTDTPFRIGRRPFHRDGLLAKWQLDDHRWIDLPFRGDLYRNERWQGCGWLISKKWQPLTDHVGIYAMTDGNAGDGGAGLQAFLDNLGFKRLRVRASLAHLRAIASA